MKKRTRPRFRLGQHVQVHSLLHSGQGVVTAIWTEHYGTWYEVHSEGNEQWNVRECECHPLVDDEKLPDDALCPPTLPSDYAIGDLVFLPGNVSGTIVQIYRGWIAPLKYLVRYVTKTGALNEFWLSGIDIDELNNFEDDITDDFELPERD